jgi:hypothetical protein
VRVRLLPILAASLLLAMAQNMPNPKEISGVPLPAPELPTGTVSVRVVRGSFDKNLPNQNVTFDVDGKTQVIATGDDGRAVLNGLKFGARVQASVTVEGERLQTQAATIAGSGLKFVLVATDPDIVKREAEDKSLAAGPAIKGAVVFGPETRVVAEMSEDRLNIFYVVEILNTARTPVDIGGPILLDLPRGARGAALMDGSTKQATVNGRRVTVTGPFGPGSTMVQLGYELPYGGDTARLDQPWPAALQQVNVLVAARPGMDLRSPQAASKRRVNQGGQEVIVASGPALPAGGALTMEITGLPHYARWPRYLALTLAGTFMSIGIWAAVFTRPRRAA